MDKPDSKNLSQSPGVYLYKDASGRIIYVGKARNLRKRILSYFSRNLPIKTTAMLSHAQSLDTLTTNTEKEALLLEASLIKKHRPHYNIVLRDDKQYVLFRLSRDEDFPRLEIVRQTKKDKARYFGPFTSGLAARQTWKSIHQAFALRRCSKQAFKNRMRPCLYYHLKQCLGPCCLPVTKEEYAALVTRVEMLLSGRSKELISSLKDQMQEASQNQLFEQAATLRDTIKAIGRTLERQSVVLPAGGDMDVLGIAEIPEVKGEGGGLALGLLFVRAGRMLDLRTFFWPALQGEERGELLTTFISQFYDAQSSIPQRLILPFNPRKLTSEAPEQNLPPVDYLEEELADTPDPLESGEDGADCPVDPELKSNLAEDLALATEVQGVMEDLGDTNTLEVLAQVLTELRGSKVRLTLAKTQAEQRLVALAADNARQAAQVKIEGKMGQRLADLLQAEDKNIELIECIDVSHTGGESTRVGMVVFEQGHPKPGAYRTYTVPDAGGDDFKALATWMEKRLAQGEPYADLVLLDGGKGQLSAVTRVLTEHNFTPPFVLAGISKAKNEANRPDRRAGNVGDHIFIPNRSNPLGFKPGSAELLYLQRIRDAAHAYVLGKHKKARGKAALLSDLDQIKGVGSALRKILWTKFDSLAEMQAASMADFAQIPGIGPKKAQIIYQGLHGETR